MNRSIETHLVTLHKVSSYVENLINQYKADAELSVKEKTDILGYINKIQKTVDDFMAVEKKTAIIGSGEKEIFGTEYKAAVKTAVTTEIKPEVLREHLNETDFIRCIKVVTKNAETFLPKAIIDSIKVVTGEKKSVVFEKI